MREPGFGPKRGRVASLAASAIITAMLAAPGVAPAAPFSHVVAGTGVDGVGNRLTLFGFDEAYAGGTGGAIVRLANSPGPAAVVVFTCSVVAFSPSHFLYASGRGTDGKTYYIGVFDDTAPFARGPYDVISTRTTAGSGPCGTPGTYPSGWFPVSTGNFIVGP
ncbi:MAG TPA: hypothetical protein VGB64_14615 [Actinomycetota bacterium]